LVAFSPIQTEKKRKPKIKKMKIKKTKELRRAFDRWVDHTTLHGIAYINDSSSLLVKFIWTVVFCGFFAFALWLLSKSFITFFDYETDTSVSRLKVNVGSE